ncbi:SpvB/TcaC N-terminal domain-containing protein [Pseudoalteromonas sp. T1lg75]|uniref:SpvB/TcaC N-terminal domain-containing protein n=1 Tax=Pseudoalteromonas sp. T1lg75 TaxID=2077102 RepID=UPI000CF6AB80|nr:SpvB/TcaC N-terminal domain-containing protein [Pseudoalteromonas sp. T1lg75]
MFNLARLYTVLIFLLFSSISLAVAAEDDLEVNVDYTAFLIEDSSETIYVSQLVDTNNEYKYIDHINVAPTNGVILIDPIYKLHITYTPNAGFCGIDSSTVVIEAYDGSGPYSSIGNTNNDPSVQAKPPVIIGPYPIPTYKRIEFNVECTNDAPTISHIENQSINEDNSISVSFTVGDEETSANDLVVSAVNSSNTELLPLGAVILEGSGSTRSISLTPTANQFGSSDITLRVSDGEGSFQDTSFRLDVTSVNDAPVIVGPNSTELAINAQTTLDFQLDDVDSPIASLSGSVSSYNAALFEALEVAVADGTAQLNIAAGASEGSTNIYLNISDQDGLTTTKSIFVQIQSATNEAAETTTQVPNDAAFVNTSAPTVNSVGAIKGSASVSGGAAKYHIPIATPPGRAGMQPQVSLNYSSRNGNGVAGVGWGLSAGSSITRCAATNAQDGYSHNPNYDATKDRLCLDGSRLMVATGTYGASGATYRTEVDSFVRITQYGSLNSSSTWFKAEYKNGRTASYGKSSNSRVVHGGQSASYAWLVAFEHDATVKNYIHYEYQTYGLGEVLLKDITYTGYSEVAKGWRKVVFEYEARPDIRGSYIAQGRVLNTQRLASIVAQHASDILYTYTLSYGDTSLSTERSLLREIEQCAPGGACLPITTLNWNEAQTKYSFEPIEFNNNGQQHAPANRPFVADLVPRGDINGDGTRDWPAYDGNQGFSANAEGNITHFTTEESGYCFRPLVQRACLLISTLMAKAISSHYPAGGARRIIYK